MPDYKGNRRKKYFIDRSFQTKFIIQFCAIIIATTLLIGFLLYIFNVGTTTVAFDNLKVLVKTTADFIFPITLQILILVTLLAAVTTVMITLITSHKISGPLYRLHVELDKMKKGDFSAPIRIRAKDQLHEVVNESEALRVEIKNTLSVLKKQIAVLEKELSRLEKNATGGETKGLRDCLDIVHNELNRFTIS
jgi:hypothetical protein